MSTTDEAGAASFPQRPMRADARRNYERLITAAKAAFAEHGPEASLDQIAKDAGVGPGTLYRHFPNRQALLLAVFRDRVERLAADATALMEAPSPGDALMDWLRSVIDYTRSNRGLTSSLTLTPHVISSCHDLMEDSAGKLLARAQQAGEFRPDVTISDLLKLVHGISMVAERVPDDPDLADRLLLLMAEGLHA